MREENTYYFCPAGPLAYVALTSCALMLAVACLGALLFGLYSESNAVGASAAISAVLTVNGYWWCLKRSMSLRVRIVLSPSGMIHLRLLKATEVRWDRLDGYALVQRWGALDTLVIRLRPDARHPQEELRLDVTGLQPSPAALLLRIEATSGIRAEATKKPDPT